MDSAPVKRWHLCVTFFPFALRRPHRASGTKRHLDRYCQWAVWTDGQCTSKSRAICYELGQTFPNALGNLKAIPVVQCHCHSGGILCAIVLVCVSALEMPNEIPHGQTILAGAFPGMDCKIAQAVSRRPLTAESRV